MTTEPTGVARKDAAHAILERNRPRLILLARRQLLAHLLVTGTATMDDVRGAVAVPEGVSPVFFGGVPHALVRAGIITRDGYRNTERAEAKDRPIAVWRLVNREAALWWLATHAAEDPS